MDVVPEAVAACGQLLNRPPISWRRPPFGLSVADRYVVVLEDDSRAFVKAATDEQTATWLRTEHAALEAVGASLGPQVLGFVDGDYPVLVTEDLSHGYWPAHDHRVEWRGGDIEALLATLRALGRVALPSGLGPIADWPSAKWANVFASGVLEAAGLCSVEWVERAAPEIVAADSAAVLELSALVHGDVRSDNVVVIDGDAKLVDWSSAGWGHPLHDLVLLLPTLHLEGAEPPWKVAEVPPELAVRLLGIVASRVDEVEMPGWLRKVFQRLTVIHLEWIAVILGLRPPDGRRWSEI